MGGREGWGQEGADIVSWADQSCRRTGSFDLCPDLLGFSTLQPPSSQNSNPSPGGRERRYQNFPANPQSFPPSSQWETPAIPGAHHQQLLRCSTCSYLSKTIQEEKRKSLYLLFSQFSRRRSGLSKKRERESRENYNQPGPCASGSACCWLRGRGRMGEGEGEAGAPSLERRKPAQVRRVPQPEVKASFNTRRETSRGVSSALPKLLSPATLG